MSTAKITALEVENFKRVKAVYLEPAENGLTIIGGDNRQGKTSVLDAIVASLAGQKFDPSDAVHEGAKKGRTAIKLSNGFSVEKSFTGRNSYLKVIDRNGGKGGQQLLNEFISEFALDIGTFIRARPKQQAQILLDALGIDLTSYDMREKKLVEEREAVGRDKRAAEGHESEIQFDEEAGFELKSSTALMAELEGIVNHNAKLREDAQKIESLRAECERIGRDVNNAATEVERLKRQLADAERHVEERRKKSAEAEKAFKDAKMAAAFGTPQDDAEIKKRMADVEAFNARVRRNLDKKAAKEKAATLAGEYQALNAKVEAVRSERLALLERAGMPLIELTVENEVLLYKGKEFDCMSGAEQMIVSTAICRKIKPDMGFVLADKLEAMDLRSLREFSEWATREGLQVIGTRVSRGEECSVIIEDGMIDGVEPPAKPTAVDIEATEKPKDVQQFTF